MNQALGVPEMRNGFAFRVFKPAALIERRYNYTLHSPFHAMRL